MTSSEQEYIKIRLDKTKQLIAKGINPYPSKFKKTHTNSEAISKFLELEPSDELDNKSSVTLAGRVVARRTMGKATFIDITDSTGRLQVMMRQNNLAEKYDLLDQLDIGDWIGTEGVIFRTRTKEITLQVDSFEIICKALRPLPEKWHGLTDIETRFRQRYLDLIANEKSVTNALIRSKLIKSIRDFMETKGFIEVETPILVPVAAGGMAHPFTTHHNSLNRDLYLRIATELHLKRLIIGGFDKVFEIGKVFRNEGVDHQHNPEFTTMESYEAFVDYKDVMAMVENLVAYCAIELTGSTKVKYSNHELDFTPPWPKFDLREKIIEVSGIDFLEHTDTESLKNALSDININVSNQVSWGGLLDKLISEKLEPTLIQPCFLLDYPIEMSPLAKKSTTNPRVVERFEGFVQGMELCNAFSELNDPVDQRNRFEEQEKLRQTFTQEETDRLDEDFLTAIEYGMPPTGGLGIGIDRLSMLLSDNESIREVILFPQLRN
jgi:lysyl-tRNA synthetase class 2